MDKIIKGGSERNSSPQNSFLEISTFLHHLYDVPLNLLSAIFSTAKDLEILGRG